MEYLLSAEEQATLISILIEHGTIDTPTERRHFWEASGLAQYDRGLPAEIELAGATKYFAQSVIYTLKQHKIPLGADHSPMLILLRYLRHLAIGQQEIVHFLEPLIERFENPLAFALPRAVAQWRATIYTGLSRLTDMGGMLTRAVAALVFTLNERIPRINAFMEDLYSIPATLYRNGTINQVDYELSEAHMHQLKIRLMRGIPDLSNLDRLSHEIATAFLFTPYELAQLRESIEERIAICGNPETHIILPILQIQKRHTRF